MARKTAAERAAEKAAQAATVAAQQQPVVVHDEAAALAAAGLVDENAEAQSGTWASMASAADAATQAIHVGNSPEAELAAMGVIDDGAPWANTPPSAMPVQPVRATSTLPSDVPRSGIITDVAKAHAVSMVPAPKIQNADRFAHAPNGTDALTIRLGARWYRTDFVAPWAKYRANGWHMHFSRFYPEQRVIVDHFHGPSIAVDNEVNEKIAAIRAFNSAAEAGAKLGYIALYVGDTPDDNTLAAALDGELFGPPLKAPLGAPFAGAVSR